MYQAGDDYEKLIQGDSRTFLAKFVVTNTGNEITEGIKSIKLTASSNSSDTFTIGSVVSSYIEAELATPNCQLENRELQVFQGMTVGDAPVYVPYGYFTVSTVESDEGVVKFTAYDRMLKTENLYSSDLTDSTTTVNVLQEMLKKLGITILTDGLTSYPMKKPVGYTYREVLSYIAMMYAGFAICDRQGRIVIKTYESTSYKITTGRYWDTFTHNDLPYQVGRISCATGQDDDGNSQTITSGDGARILSISNPFMTQEQLDVVYNKLKTFSFMPGSLTFLGDNCLDVWDIVTVEDLDGNSYSVPCMQLVQDWDGGLSTELTAYGETESESEVDYQGPNAQMYDRIVAKVGYYQKLNVNRLTAAEGSIDKLDSQQANIINLLAGNAVSDSSLTIHLTADNAVIDSALIGDAVIDSLEFDKIKGVDINTTKITVHSDDGRSYWHDNTIIMSDSERVRIQMGEDAEGDYNLYIFDKNGSLMFDALGLCEDGINRPIIKDAYVADDANISGSKLDISSVIEGINENGNTTLKSNKILFDDEKGTLDIYLSTMEKSVDGLVAGEGDYYLDVEVESGYVFAGTASSGDSSEAASVASSGGDDVVIEEGEGNSEENTAEETNAIIHAKIYKRTLNDDGCYVLLDVTDQFNDEQFIWTRRSEDEEADRLWNDQGKQGKDLTVTAQDSPQSATFIVTFSYGVNSSSSANGSEENVMLTSADETIDANGQELVALSAEAKATVYIKDLPSQDSAVDSDYLIVDNGSTTRKLSVGTVFERIKRLLSYKVDIEKGKGLSSNDYTSDEKEKLAGIEEGAEKNKNAYGCVGFVIGDSSPKLSNAKSASDTLYIQLGDGFTITTKDGLTIALNDATSGTHGAMSADDKTKLDSVEEGAQKNVNGFGGVEFYNDGILDQSSRYSITAESASQSVYILLDPSMAISHWGSGVHKVTLNDATSDTHGLLSIEDKAKLDGIDEGANNYTHPTYNEVYTGFYKVGINAEGHVIATTAVTKADITALGIPSQDTTYEIATKDTDGLLSATDKTKLDGVEEGAQKNANNFTEFAFYNGGSLDQDDKYSITASSSGQTANIILDPAMVISHWGSGIHQILLSDVTSDTHGLMTATDKDKLDGIATGANKYTHPTYTSKSSGLYKITVNSYGHVSAATAVVKSDITGLGIPSQDTTYSAMTGATSSKAGSSGLVPAPSSGSQDKFLRGDGTWATPESSTTEEDDSGWITLAPASGYSHLSGYTVQYRKVGKVVEIRGVYTNSSSFTPSTSWLTLATLPTDYRPSATSARCNFGTGRCTFGLRVTSAGSLQFSRYSDSTTYSSKASGQNINVGMTYLVD